MKKKITITAKKYSPICFAFALNLLFFYPTIFENKTFFLRDIHRWFYPMKFFLAKSLKAGEIPFWCSNYFCGSPFMSDIQSGVFYPPSIIFVLFPFPLSLNIFVMFHLFLAFCFFYLFITEMGVSRRSALLVAISYCYGGYLFATINTLNNLTTAIWLPAILWSFNRARSMLEDGSFFVLTIVFISMAILGGEPQLCILMGAILFLYAITTAPKRTKSKLQRFKSGATVLILGGWAILIAMVQLGPTFMDYQHSARLGGLSYEEASRFSMTWSMLKHLLLPLHFNEGFSASTLTLRNFFPGNGEIPWLLTIYPGVIILPLAIIGTVFSLSKRNCIWPIIFIISLLLALGNNSPAHFIFYKLLPIFRFPEKFMLLAGFSMLVMAAYGFDRLFWLMKINGLKQNLTFFFFTSLLMLDLFSNNRNLNPLCNSEFYSYHHPALQPIIDDPALFRVYADKIPTPEYAKNSINHHHIKWQMMLLPNLGTIQNLYHVGGVSALELRYQHQIGEILLKPWEEKIHFLRLANVKYIISQDRLDREPALKGKVEKINGLVYQIVDFLPRAWVAGQVKRIENGTVNELISDYFDPSKTALMQGKVEKRYSTPFSHRVDRVSYGKNGEIHIAVQTEKSGIIVISESSYPGWKVYVDGEEKKCLWVDLLFQGVEIERGKHTIIFLFRPKNFDVFFSISLISSIFLIALWVFFKGKDVSSFDHPNNPEGEEGRPQHDPFQEGKS